jgi:regulatory protein
MFIHSVEYKSNKIPLSPDLALHKMKSWCAYQERSQDETRRKLYEYNLSPEETDQIIADLISENFLNEERFAMAFAGGKFRIKQWGRSKIKMELKKHKVSDYSINKALKSIDAADYEKAIVKTIEKKRKLLKVNDPRKQFYALLTYLASRGFESDLVTEQLNNILQKN